MNLFGNKKDKDASSSSPVMSEKTKESAGLLKRTTSKIGEILKNKFGSKKAEATAEQMSSSEYLGEIYKMLVENKEQAKLEQDKQISRREEEDSEDQKRHAEIIKALTIRRRPKPKRVIRRERKEEEKAKKAEEKPPTKPEPKTPEKKPETKAPEKKPETKPETKAPEKKPETKPPEKKPEPKPETKPPEKKPETKAPEKKPEPKPETKAPEKKPETKPPETKPPEKIPEKQPSGAEKGGRKGKTEEVTKPKKETAEKQPPAEKKPSAEPVKQVPKPGKRTAEMIKQAGVGVVAAISAVGVTNVYAQKAILQTSYKESQIDVKSNEATAADYLKTMEKRGYGYIQQTFPQLKPGNRLSKSLGYDKEGVPESLVKKRMMEGNESFYDLMYGGTLGNKDPGDGWRYRGRGLVAITGRSNYEQVSKILNEMGVKVDLVKNPDLLQNPDIAYKAAVAYYIMTLEKGNVKKGLERLNSYKNQDEALREIIRATAGMGHDVKGFEVGYKGNKFNEKGEAVGEHLFVNYERAKSASGVADDIIKMSKDNQDMKKQNGQGDQQSNQQYNNVDKGGDSKQVNPVDDRPPFKRK